VAIFLGIDGGGTKTSCLIGDETSILGRGSGPGSNIVRGGEALARASMAHAVQEACRDAGINPGQIQRACAGMAGATTPQIVEIIRRIVREMGVRETLVVGDMETAMEAAFDGRPGVIVIAGTGSVAYGNNASGKIARAGGWGFAVSDEGSGHWIGKMAVSAVLHAHDTGADSTLLQKLLKAWSLGSFEQLVVAANATPPANFGGLVPVVIAAGDAGETVAQEVLRKAGLELAKLAATAARQLFGQYEDVPIAMSGGVFANCALVRETFSKELRAQFPRVVINPEVVEPVQGALALARKGKP
jgi:N-acetylglucosamine kinase-like BadF-type ATPase